MRLTQAERDRFTSWLDAHAANNEAQALQLDAVPGAARMATMLREESKIARQLRDKIQSGVDS